MKNTFKIINLGILGLSSLLFNTSSNAASFDIKLGVDAKAGCILRSNDFNFGNIKQSDLVNATWINENIKVTQNLFIRCSQGTSFNLGQQGLFAQSGSDFNHLFLNGNTSATSNSIIQYVLKTTNVQDNNKFTIYSRPHSEKLGSGSDGGYNYLLQIKALTGSEFQLPIDAVLNNNLGFSNYSGNYTDTVTYKINF